MLVTNVFTFISWSWYTPVFTSVLTLRQRVQHLEFNSCGHHYSMLWPFAYHGILFHWLICLNAGSDFNLIELQKLPLRFWINKDFLAHNKLISHTFVNTAVDDSARGCAVSNHVRNIRVCTYLPIVEFQQWTHSCLHSESWIIEGLYYAHSNALERSACIMTIRFAGIVMYVWRKKDFIRLIIVDRHMVLLISALVYTSCYQYRLVTEISTTSFLFTQ